MKNNFVIFVSPLVHMREKTCLCNLRRKTMVVISCCSRTSFQHVYIFKQVLAYPLIWFLCLTFRESEDSLSEPCAQVMMPNGTVNNLTTKLPTISAEIHYSRIHIKTTKNVYTRKLKLTPVGGIVTSAIAKLVHKRFYMIQK